MCSRKKLLSNVSLVSLLMMAASGCSSNLERMGNADQFYTNSTAPQQSFGAQQSYPGDRPVNGRSMQAVQANPQYVQPKQAAGDYYQSNVAQPAQQAQQQVQQQTQQQVQQAQQRVVQPVQQTQAVVSKQLDPVRAATIKPIDHSVNAGSKVQYNAPSNTNQQLAPAPVAAPAQQDVQVASLPAKTPAKSDSAANQATQISSFRWPAQGRVIAKFGQSVNGAANEGIDISLPEGTPVKAAEGGTVIYSGSDVEGFGNLVIVRHADNWVSAYAHASQIFVKRGQTIRRGQTIAKSGRTGNATTPKLHFELRRKSTPVDPLRHLG